MSTNFKSGVLDIRITRYAGGEGVGPKLIVSRPCEDDNFSASNVWGRLKEDRIRMTLAEAKQIGETLIALSSEDTSDKVELNHE
jgi:hypothetical protein